MDCPHCEIELKYHGVVGEKTKQDMYTCSICQSYFKFPVGTKKMSALAQEAFRGASRYKILKRNRIFEDEQLLKKYNLDRDVIKKFLEERQALERKYRNLELKTEKVKVLCLN